MKKRLVMMMLSCAMIVTSLSACGGNKQTETPTIQNGAAGTQAIEGQKTIKWAVWDIALTTYYEPLIQAFEAANPNVKVEMVDLGSADYQTVLATELTGNGSDLDVVMIKDPPSYTTLVNKGVLEPLDEYIAKDNVDLSVISDVTNQLKIKDKLYEMPFRNDFWLVYYNKDIFDRVGVDYPTNDMTIAEYDKLARSIANIDEGIYGNHYHTWRSAVQLFGILDGKHTIVDGSYDFLKPYYETILSQQEDMICQDYATLKTSSLHYSGAFSQGNIGMMTMGAWFIPTLINKIAAGEYTEVTNWGLVKYPHPEGVEAGTTLGVITCVAIPTSSSNKDLAWEFVKFISSQEGAEVLAKTGTFPVYMNEDITELLVSMEGFPQDETSKEALQTVKSYLEMPIHEKSAELEIILNEAHDNIMTGNMTVDEGISEMNEKAGAVLGQ